MRIPIEIQIEEKLPYIHSSILRTSIEVRKEMRTSMVVLRENEEYYRDLNRLGKKKKDWNRC